MKVKVLIKSIQESYNAEDYIIAHIWSRGDVLGAAEEMNVKLTTSEADDILDDIYENIDSELGISWTTIRCGIEDFLERRKNG